MDPLQIFSVASYSRQGFNLFLLTLRSRAGQILSPRNGNLYSRELHFNFTLLLLHVEDKHMFCAEPFTSVVFAIALRTLRLSPYLLYVQRTAAFLYGSSLH